MFFLFLLICSLYSPGGGGVALTRSFSATLLGFFNILDAVDPRERERENFHRVDTYSCIQSSLPGSWSLWASQFQQASWRRFPLAGRQVGARELSSAW